jgi:hypothetical protein
MADRNFAEGPKTLRRGVVQLFGWVDIHTDGTVLTTSKFTGGAWTGDAGVYTLTLEDKYIRLVGCSALVKAGTAVDLVPQLKSETVATTKLVVFDLNTGATPTDPSAVCSIFVTLWLENSDGNP